MKLAALAHGRSGDKGDICNISVIAFDALHFEHLRRHVTAARVKAHLAGFVQGEVIRYELAQLGAMNFVLLGALGGGVTRSLRLDAHGKCLGLVLLDMDIPEPADG